MLNSIFKWPFLSGEQSVGKGFWIQGKVHWITNKQVQHSHPGRWASHLECRGLRHHLELGVGLLRLTGGAARGLLESGWVPPSVLGTKLLHALIMKLTSYYLNWNFPTLKSRIKEHMNCVSMKREQSMDGTWSAHEWCMDGTRSGCEWHMISTWTGHGWHVISMWMARGQSVDGT